jgi:hypothetical protein
MVHRGAHGANSLNIRGTCFGAVEGGYEGGMIEGVVIVWRICHGSLTMFTVRVMGG